MREKFHKILRCEILWIKFQDTKFAKRGFKKFTQHLISREYRRLEQAVREKQRERKFVRIARIKILAWLYFYNIEFCGQNSAMQQGI